MTQLVIKKQRLLKQFTITSFKYNKNLRFIKTKNKKQCFNQKKIFLLTKNLKTKKISEKLNYVKIDSFFIKKQKKSVNYKLNLFLNIRIHLIFYVLLLKLADQNTFIQKTFYFQYKKKIKTKLKQY